MIAVAVLVGQYAAKITAGSISIIEPALLRCELNTDIWQIEILIKGYNGETACVRRYRPGYFPIQ